MNHGDRRAAADAGQRAVEARMIYGSEPLRRKRFAEAPQALKGRKTFGAALIGTRAIRGSSQKGASGWVQRFVGTQANRIRCGGLL